MVSKVCHSQLSSSTFARAAHIPPWAAPVWDRVGYSLVITAVRARRELSSAARRPAPPAPTITTSKVCCWVMGLLGGLGGEGEDRERAKGPGQADHGGVHALVEEAPGAGAGVVVDDHPQAVAAVEQGQGEHGEVVDPPERVGPAAGHEGEVDPVQAAVEHVHDREVAEHEQDQQDPGDAHEHPGVELEVAPAGFGLAAVGGGRAGEGGRRHVGGHGLQLLDHVGADGDHRGDGQEQEQHRLDIEHLALAAHPLGPEVEQDDPQAVEGVEDDHHGQADLQQPHEGVAVGVDHPVVGLGGDVQQGLVDHVGEQVEQDRHAGDPVQDPGPHPLTAAVQRAQSLHPVSVTPCAESCDQTRIRTGPASTLPPGNRPWVEANRLLSGGFGRGRVWSYGLASTMSSEAAERLVAGRWTLETALRGGPSGVIWRATEVAGGRHLAVEQLRLPAPPDPGDPGQSAVWDRVAVETRAAASLDHAGLVGLEDVVVEDGVVFVATELVDAALTLDELVARHGPLPVRRAAQLGLELLDALEAAHAAGLAHLDLRPGNVLVTADGRARLAGVGLATLRRDLGAGSPGADRSYLAPEQLRGDPVGPPADLWSLGTILWLAVEGEPPFAGEGTDATATAILDAPPPPATLAGPLTPALHALLTKPPGGRPTIPDARRLLEPPAGVPPSADPGTAAPGAAAPGTGAPTLVPGVPHPPRPTSAPPEGESSWWGSRVPGIVHSPPYGSRAARNAMDPVVQRVLLIAGGSIALALLAFVVAVAVTGDPLGLRSQAVASTVAAAPPTTVAPSTAPPTTVPPST